jgi:hypothetical protein
MPEFTVKEVRLPELHLPEIKRDEIVRSLSGVHLPEVDLARARRASIGIPAVAVSSSDVGKLLAAAATVARLVRPAPSRTSRLAGSFGRRWRSPVARIVQPRRRRSRWPLVAGGVLVVVLGAWAILRRPAVRHRVEVAAHDAWARFDELRGGNDNTAVEVLEPVALVATETDGAGPAPTASEQPDEPDAIATDASGTPALEETGTPS